MLKYLIIGLLVASHTAAETPSKIDVTAVCDPVTNYIDGSPLFNATYNWGYARITGRVNKPRTDEIVNVWSPYTTNRFNALRAGSYIFLVTALDGMGSAGQTAGIKQNIGVPTATQLWICQTNNYDLPVIHFEANDEQYYFLNYASGQELPLVWEVQKGPLATIGTEISTDLTTQGLYSVGTEWPPFSDEELEIPPP